MSDDTFKPKIGDGSTILPQARVKTIMKSSPDTENISVEALYYITKATEFFIEHIAQEIYESNAKEPEISYSGLAEVVQSCDAMEFLKEMVPKKITYDEYKKLLQEEKDSNADLF